MKNLLILTFVCLSISACGTGKLARVKPHLYDDGNKVYEDIQHKSLSILTPCEEKRLKVKSIARTGIVTKDSRAAFRTLRNGGCGDL